MRAMETEIRSALPDAPVVAEPTPAEARPRAYRTRAAIATGFARIADAVAPSRLDARSERRHRAEPRCKP